MANKSKKATQKKRMTKVATTTSQTFQSISQGITGVGVFAMLVVFPLYTHDMYFDVLSARYVFFKLIIFGMLILQVALGVLYLVVDRDATTSNPAGGALTRLLNALKPENLKDHVMITDIFMLLMVIVSTLGTLGAGKYQQEAFYGNAGRYQGLDAWIMYLLLYVMVTRTFKYKRMYLDTAIVAGVGVCLWGISDYFAMNIFGFMTNVQEGQRFSFTSSIGNINTYTNYTIMIFVLAAVLFMIEKNRYKTIFYGLCAFIGILGTMFGISDNQVLSFGAFFIMAPFVVMKNKRAVIRYLYTCAMFFFGIDVLNFARGLSIPHSTGYSFWMTLYDEVSILKFVFVLFLIAAVVLEWQWKKQKNVASDGTTMISEVQEEKAPKLIHRIWLMVVVAVVGLFALMLIDINITHVLQSVWDKLSFTQEFVFNDDWGSHRGYAWKIGLKSYADENLFNKLFGVGPDTYLVVSETKYYYEMVEKYGEVYDSAHNEYLNYLVCQGLVGLISYLGLFVGGVVLAIKSMKKDWAIAAVALAVVAYLVQAFVNIAIPITTPVLFTLLYIGVAYYYRNVMVERS